MAVNILRRTHAHHLCKQLTRNERNSLRIILLTDTGLADLREALGQTMQHISDPRSLDRRAEVGRADA